MSIEEKAAQIIDCQQYMYLRDILREWAELRIRAGMSPPNMVHCSSLDTQDSKEGDYGK